MPSGLPMLAVGLLERACKATPTGRPAVADLPERGTNLVQVSSVPAEMRAEVQLEGQEVWTFTTVRYVDAPEQPGLAVGALLASFMGEDTPEMRAKFLSTIPIGRFSTPEDLGNAACFLASDEASYITGQVICVDGGMSL